MTLRNLTIAVIDADSEETIFAGTAVLQTPQLRMTITDGDEDNIFAAMTVVDRVE